MLRLCATGILRYGSAMQHTQRTKDTATIRDVFPDFSDEQLREAEEQLQDYLAFVLRMYSRIRADPAAYARFNALTVGRRSRTMESKGRFLTGHHVSNP